MGILSLLVFIALVFYALVPVSLSRGSKGSSLDSSWVYTPTSSDSYYHSSESSHSSCDSSSDSSSSDGGGCDGGC